MPQVQYHLDTPLSKDEIAEFKDKTQGLPGVKFVTVNVDGKSIVVTHDSSYDEAQFKSTAGL